MRGYCKCDLCDVVYHKKDNEFYDGIAVWRNNWTGSSSLHDDDEKIITTDREPTDIPATMDLCPNCFKQFYNWIEAIRSESKSHTNNKDFPMNKPE